MLCISDPFSVVKPYRERFKMFYQFTPFFEAPGDPAPGSGGSDPKPGNTPAPKETEPGNTDLQNSLAAARRREAEANKKLEELTNRLTAFETAEKERKEAEMSELEKAQAKIAELTGQVDQLTPFKLESEAREKAAAEKVEELAKDLTEDQKAIMDAISTNEAKVRYIEQIKSAAASKPGLPSGGKPPTTNGDFIDKATFERNKNDRRWMAENIEKVNASMTNW